MEELRQKLAEKREKMALVDKEEQKRNEVPSPQTVPSSHYNLANRIYSKSSARLPRRRKT